MVRPHSRILTLQVLSRLTLTKVCTFSIATISARICHAALRTKIAHKIFQSFAKSSLRLSGLTEKLAIRRALCVRSSSGKSSSLDIRLLNQTSSLKLPKSRFAVNSSCELRIAPGDSCALLSRSLARQVLQLRTTDNGFDS